MAPALLLLKPMIRLALALILSLNVAACGKSFAPRDFDTETKDFTGAVNPKGLPYTGAADSAELEILKQSIDPTPKENRDLAASIKAVSIVRQDAAGKAVTTAPTKLAITISFDATPLVFSVALNSSHEASAVTSTPGSDVRLNVRCLESDCAAIEVRINKGTAEGGFLFRIRAVTLEILGPFAVAGSATTNLDRISQIVANEKSPLMMTTETAWGPAMFELRAGDVLASGDLVATGGDEENVSIQAKDSKALDARLVGNSNHGDLLLRIGDGASWAFMRVRLPVAPTGAGTTPVDAGDDDTSTTPVLPDDTAAPDRYIPYDPANPITARFQRDKTNPVVQEEIKNMSVGKRSGDMKKFLSQARPNLPLLTSTLAAQQVPPEFLFLTFVESHFFYSNGAPYDISVSAAKAVGPWQFMPDTGRGLGLKVFDVTKVNTRIVDGKQRFRYVANPCDERNDLEKSSVAAAKFLRELLNKFQHDPKLAIMAYNMGGGGVRASMKKASAQIANEKCADNPLCTYDMAKIPFWELYRLNIGPLESRNYVVRFLAAQFVGRAPSKMGVTYDTSFATPAPKLPATCASAK